MRFCSIFCYRIQTNCFVYLSICLWSIFKDSSLMGKCSVRFSSVVSDSLQPHGLQHARPPCTSPTPRVYSNSCPSSQWSHPTTSPFVIPFSCHQSFPESGSFQMSQFFRGQTEWKPLEKGMANHLSILALRTPWTEQQEPSQSESWSWPSQPPELCEINVFCLSNPGYGIMSWKPSGIIH